MATVRRRTLLGAAAASGGVSMGLSAVPERGHAGGPPDNVLWVITDDQPRTTLRYMRGTSAQLVKRGKKFRNGYSAVPWCGPARASIMTGLFEGNHQCTNLFVFAPFIRRGLDQDTVATRLAAAGYTNGYFGKYMNGHASDPEYVAPGWQRWVANVAPAGGGASTFNIDGDLREVSRPDRFAAVRCERFVRAHADGPWFAVFAPTTPHDPYEPSTRHVHDFDGIPWDPPALNEPDMRDKPTWLRDHRPVNRSTMRDAWEGKLEELQDLDDWIVSLLAALKETHQRSRTWIFLVSDNGYLLGQHRLYRKEQPYEECAGVPFVVAGPDVSAGRPEVLVSQVDLMPTTLDIAGLDPYDGRAVDGRSMLAGLTSGRWTGWRRRLLCENVARGWALLREGRWAYVDNYGRGGDQEIYDLRADPHQLHSRHARVDTTTWKARTDALRQATGEQLRELEVAT